MSATEGKPSSATCGNNRSAFFRPLAGAMERIVTARATVSIAHRSYSEGDRLLAEAERQRAEARKLEA
jgi:hypothetical protein